MENRKPGFGQKRKVDAYYSCVTLIVESLRPKSTLATIAAYLNSQNLQTPNDLPWDRRRLSDFIRFTMKPKQTKE